MNNFEYDLVILGGGPAGLSAAIYGARGNAKTAVIDTNMIGGQPTNYLEVENYPGFKLMGGFELMEQFEEHADKFNVEKFPMEEIVEIKFETENHKIKTLDKEFTAKTVIIATGAGPKKLGIKGEAEFLSRGVSYCAVCDGAFFRDKVVTVIGGGNAAVEEAMYLTKFAQKVYLVHRRDQLRADKIVQERAFMNPKIEFVWNAVPVEILGTNSVEKIVLKDVNTEAIKELETQGVFPYVGFTPNSKQFEGQIQMDAGGFIITDGTMKTSQEGVYAAGDIRVTPLRQIITAASDGAISATSAVRYLETVEYKVTV
jgi:thioredoxin reductase (NADPH)